MDEYKYSISRTVQAKQYEPVMYTARGETPEEVKEGLDELMKVYPPTPVPKEEGDFNKEMDNLNLKKPAGEEKTTSGF